MKSMKEVVYPIKDDIEFIKEAEKLDSEEFSRVSGIAKNTVYEIMNGHKTTKEVCEKFYSYAYLASYRINQVKEEFLKESSDLILFHGSKCGIESIDCNGSRLNCDFGTGFYLGESYDNALSFVCENKNSCVYSFKMNLSGLNVVTFECNLEWMLAICFFRGQLNGWNREPVIEQIIEKVNSADVIIAPIADNRMFYIMSLFVNGDITDKIALHSLSASKMGLQYVLKTERALDNLVTVDRYYLSEPEKKDCHDRLEKRTLEIDTKLKMAKREYRDGKYIEELFK